MKKVEVRLYAGLRQYHPNPGNKETFFIEVEDKAKLGSLLDGLKLPKQELGIAMVNGKWAKEDYVLQDGDRIGLFPLIGGG